MQKNNLGLKNEAPLQPQEHQFPLVFPAGISENIADIMEYYGS